LGSRNGRPIGSYGDLSIFCLYKTIGLPDGAAVISNFPPKPPPPRHHIGAARIALRHGLYVTQRWAMFAELTRRLGGWGWITELRRRLGRGGEYDPGQDIALGDPEIAPYASVDFLLKRQTYSAVQSARAANYAFLLKQLKRFVPEQLAHLPEGASPFVFPIQSDHKEVLARLSRYGIVAGYVWPIPHPCLPEASFPQAAALRKNTIALPVHQELRVQELERIVDAVHHSLKSA
jgi:perosamine synthetase